MRIVRIVCVLHGADMLADILVERAAARNVEQLQAAADAKDRLLLSKRPTRQEQLGVIAGRVYAADRRNCAFTI